MKSRAIRWALAWTLLPIVSFAADAAKSDFQPAMYRIACVGDSITYGAAVRNRQHNCYPAVLGRTLGAGYDVRNFGVNGATLLKKGDRPYWKLDAFRKASAFAPHLVLLKLGTNDSKPQNWKHAAEFSANLEELVDHFLALPSRPRVVLLAPAPVYRDRWGINEKTVKGEVLPKVRQIASRRGLQLVDINQGLRGFPDEFPDGIHPNEFGAKRLAQVVHTALALPKLVNKKRPTRPNFIVMIADDMAWNDCGAYGHPKIRTPNIDALASAGMRFDRAFLSCSSCSPSRSSIMTSRYPHSTGAKELHQPLPAA
ncbi:MAG: GDSL-type esterase/lipase family protein, partial [Planctomycetota bacterium]